METGLHTKIDMSEEKRLAQLRRIEELKGQIGDLPSWFNPKPLHNRGYDFQGYDQQSYPYMNSHIDSFQTSHSPFGSNGSSSTGPCSTGDQLPDQKVLYVLSNTTKDTRYGDDDLQFNHENASHLAHEQLVMGTGIELMDMSDEASQSQRMSSTPSKASGLSSKTSTDAVDIKLEMEENVVLKATQGNSSPTSSVSSKLSPAKSTTPIGLHPPENHVKPKRRRRPSKSAKLQFSELRPRTSIPTNIPHEELARQSIEAALSSRLNPFALHQDEYQLLRNHICQLHVSAYINIRNRILRLWVRNPLVSVTTEEAAGCAYSSRWLGLAEVAYEWLLRRGYINFGCVEVPESSDVEINKRSKVRRSRKTIVVVGAGMAGLGCARQLEGLFSHYRDRWSSKGEEPPEVVILEGRSRIGGRIYSHPLRNQDSSGIPNQKRCVAEMGAHIITGFDHGNPLNMIIRGQLALHYYPLKDNSSLYDIDGRVVNRQRDKLVEKLFNDILDRASVYRHKTAIPPTSEGDRELIEAGRDPHGEGGGPIGSMDQTSRRAMQEFSKDRAGHTEQVPGGLDKLTGKAHMVSGSRTKAPAEAAAVAMGWRIFPSLQTIRDVDLDKVVNSSEYPTLGEAMDEGVRQYQSLLGLSAQDMRLLNWHFANLEYANAANVGKLSLGGWDQDIGNEFEGEHAQVIGGYQQVPRGIWQYPTQLDLRTRKAVTRISYDPKDGADNACLVETDDGETIEARHIVLTAPLGVLKSDTIAFRPQLPSWKRRAIEQLGFGVLNKVILVFEQPFWDVDQDMIGLLRDSVVENSLDQADYIRNRGRFYLFWNCIKTSGRPVLIGLMAGDAAHHAEMLTDAQIVGEVTQQLAKMYKLTQIPAPTETIVTRWGQDRFARGTYSYVGARAQSGDYDAMAKPVGNLHFAGEATCGTHPATVHGAYISGLRAASEIIDDLLGPIVIPSPLVPIAPTTKPENESVAPKNDFSTVLSPSSESADLRQARLESFETEILKAIFSKLGPRPDKPGRSSANPFLLFSKEKWSDCKAKCDEARRAALGASATKASRNEIRTALGQMWRDASAAIKQPYVDQTVSNRVVNHESAATFQDRVAEWDAEAMRARSDYVRAHPDVLSKEEESEMWKALGVFGGAGRKAKKMSGYADRSGSEMET
ncbi:hypothetical protein MMC19_002004 [Ptychographa xylographoides]|nr:hypothetical protein [Ptychographa xylographoides]